VSRGCQGAALAALILLGNIAYVSSHMGFLHRSKTVLETDHRNYMEMAWGPPWRADVEAPFCWRLLTPYLVFGLMKTGLGMNAAFYLLTNAALFGFLLTLHAYLGRLGFDARFSALGLALVGLLQGAVRWYEYQYWMTDPLCLFLVVLGFLLVREGRHVWLVLLSVVAVCVRETYVVVLLYLLLYLLQRKPLRIALGRTATVALPALTILFLIRYVLVPRPSLDLLATLQEALGFRWRHLLDNQLYFATLGSFGVLLPLALLFPRRVLVACRHHYDEAAVVATVYLSLAFANNTDRLLVYALPVVLPGALRGLRDGLARARVPWAAAALVVLGLQVLLYVQTHFHGELGISIYQPTSWTVILAMVGFWLAFRWRLRAVRGQVP